MFLMTPKKSCWHCLLHALAFIDILDVLDRFTLNRLLLLCVLERKTRIFISADVCTLFSLYENEIVCEIIFGAPSMGIQRYMYSGCFVA